MQKTFEIKKININYKFIYIYWSHYKKNNYSIIIFYYFIKHTAILFKIYK